LSVVLLDSLTLERQDSTPARTDSAPFGGWDSPTKVWVCAWWETLRSRALLKECVQRVHRCGSTNPEPERSAATAKQNRERSAAERPGSRWMTQMDVPAGSARLWHSMRTQSLRSASLPVLLL